MITKKWIPGLDTIRFFLAVWVMLSHYPLGNYLAPYIGHFYFGKLFVQILNSSFVGVAAVIGFFILSGLVIHFPYRNGGKKLETVDFLLKRYLRIGVPMLAISIIALYFNKFWALPFWSLYCELIYYTLYPIFLLLIRRGMIQYLIIFTFITSYIVLFLFSGAFQDLIAQNPLIDSIHNGNYHQLGLKLTWFLGLPIWLLGVNIAEKYDDFKNKFVGLKEIYLWRLMIIGFSIICFILRYKASLSFSISLNLFGLMGAVWLEKEICFWSKHKTISAFESAGKWTYSLYICHVLSPSLLSYFNVINITSLASWSIIIIFSLFFSYLFFLLVEKPSHQLSQQSFNFLKKLFS
jgi:peptidoglycan/LPS O-acetylase OafA/YrhL